MMFDFEHRLPELASQTVLCIGDLMLDDFVYGEVLRISPEAPAPVIAVGREEVVIGGAGNVARNIAALGARCLFVGVVGEDEAGRRLMDAARQQGKPLVVDPKGSDFSIYRGATVITPNRKELADATRRAAVEEEDVAAAAAELCRTLESRAVLVTRSEAGMTLVVEGAAPVHVPAYPVKIRDVSGAGDTVVAVLACLLALGAGFESAARAANAGAAVVVGKRGTATVSAAELRSRILPAASLASEEKIVFDWSLLDERLGEWRGLRIGFTNGCFDLLHPGHIKLLSEAHAACDRLIVGLNDDASVRRLKGEGRPLQAVHARAEVLAALEAVDLVVVFEQDTPLELIRRVRPKVLVKGGDYRREEVVGHELVEGEGGEVIHHLLAPVVAPFDKHLGTHAAEQL